VSDIMGVGASLEDSMRRKAEAVCRPTAFGDESRGRKGHQRWELDSRRCGGQDQGKRKSAEEAEIGRRSWPKAGSAGCSSVS
jgi:hypothetical protein